MKNWKNDEGGMLIVEASIVFPVMFLVIFLMIFAGNAYLQKCKVESVVTNLAIEGAAYCADPMLDDMEAGSIPSLSEHDIYPYRYLLTGEMGEIEDKIYDKLDSSITGMGTGLFSGMKPKNHIIDVKYHNGFIYSTFSVDAEYKIEIPVRLLGESDYISLAVSSHAEMPVSDTSEFIRNVDMVGDYMEKFGVTEKINQMIDKVKEWMS